MTDRARAFAFLLVAAVAFATAATALARLAIGASPDHAPGDVVFDVDAAQVREIEFDLPSTRLFVARRPDGSRLVLHDDRASGERTLCVGTDVAERVFVAWSRLVVRDDTRVARYPIASRRGVVRISTDDGAEREFDVGATARPTGSEVRVYWPSHEGGRTNRLGLRGDVDAIVAGGCRVVGDPASVRVLGRAD